MMNPTENKAVFEVKAESLCGFHRGDFLFVARLEDRQPADGDRVLFEVAGNVSVRYFRQDRQGCRLESLNEGDRPIRIGEKVKVLGVVDAMLRQVSFDGMEVA